MGCSQVVRQRTLTPLFVGSSPPIPVYLFYYFYMTVEIQFNKGTKEESLPIIKLTKSKNGKTGTATFVFVNPNIFDQIRCNPQIITGMYLLWDNKEIIANDITIIFKQGKPFLLKIICIFKNPKDWFNFLNFMNSYSKETGLFFAENSSSF